MIVDVLLSANSFAIHADRTVVLPVRYMTHMDQRFFFFFFFSFFVYSISLAPSSSLFRLMC
jgi:hypothetical protein